MFVKYCLKYISKPLLVVAGIALIPLVGCPSVPSCTLRLSPNSLSIRRGLSASFDVVRDSGCGNDSVALTSNAGAEFAVTFNPGSGTGNSSVGTVLVRSNANLNIYRIIVTATAAGGAVSGELVVTVLQ